MEQIDIKQQIETMIADEHYRPLSLAQLQETLGLTTTEEFVAMNKAVNELAEQYVIVFSQKGNLMPARMGGYYQGCVIRKPQRFRLSGIWKERTASTSRKPICMGR